MKQREWAKRRFGAAENLRRFPSILIYQMPTLITTEWAAKVFGEKRKHRRDLNNLHRRATCLNSAVR